MKDEEEVRRQQHIARMKILEELEKNKRDKALEFITSMKTKGFKKIGTTK